MANRNKSYLEEVHFPFIYRQAEFFGTEWWDKLTLLNRKVLKRLGIIWKSCRFGLQSNTQLYFIHPFYTVTLPKCEEVLGVQFKYLLI